VEQSEGAEAGAGSALSGADPRVFMTGPAEKVFDCDLSPALLSRLGWPAAHSS